VRVLPAVDVAPFGEDLPALSDHVRQLIMVVKARLDAQRAPAAVV
jgi:hypothetical protein